MPITGYLKFSVIILTLLHATSSLAADYGYGLTGILFRQSSQNVLQNLRSRGFNAEMGKDGSIGVSMRTTEPSMDIEVSFYFLDSGELSEIQFLSFATTNAEMEIQSMFWQNKLLSYYKKGSVTESQSSDKLTLYCYNVDTAIKTTGLSSDSPVLRLIMFRPSSNECAGTRPVTAIPLTLLALPPKREEVAAAVPKAAVPSSSAATQTNSTAAWSKADCEKLFTKIETAASRGNKYSMGELALLFESGEFQFGHCHLNRDDDDALRWARKSPNEAKSQYVLGRLYEGGRAGLDGDDTVAYQWYKKSGDGGYPPGANRAEKTDPNRVIPPAPREGFFERLDRDIRETCHYGPDGGRTILSDSRCPLSNRQ